MRDRGANARLAKCLNSVLNVKAVVAAFNQEKALVGAFSVIPNLRIAFVGSTIQPAAGELLPSDMRSLGCGLLGVLDNISLFVAVKTVPALVSGLGIHGAFLLYSCCCLANIVICFFVMPETKGLTLEEIEDSYKKRERRVSITC